MAADITITNEPPTAVTIRLALDRHLATIDPESETAKTDIAVLWSTFAAVATIVRDAKAQLEGLALETIALQGDIPISPTTRLYAGQEKKWRLLDAEKCTRYVLDAADGDLSKLTPGENGLLASSPWKHGAVRALIGDARFAEIFIQEIATDLKTGAAKGIKCLEAREQ